MFISDISGPMNASVFKFYIHLQRVEVYCLKEKPGTVIQFACFVLLFPFSIRHLNVRHREICVKDFSGTKRPRILKVCTNIGFDLLYSVRDSQHSPAYHSLYLTIFLSFS